ncbi:glycosyltransferase [Boudabousia marimammalium]|uniref:Glycosyltransferase subfamily 4-like N-terminal domain-containing protein n=1 Tax=Boudabousia marimammalium TaxID=156892 RepID=A0A1Q5PRN3_9ACTO|nr:glycosyltransferase [Boudabousia marimammalium]OKL50231.1 hypothetical protein BM477_02220 [Boudabousia marimammalium]
MAYSEDTRVLHINDVARVGSMMTNYARSQGRHWALATIPPGKPTLASVKSRLDDLLTASQRIKPADILHIHYAPNGYYGWGFDGPLVIHFHGTDLRQDLYQPIKRQLIQQSVKRASAVVYATPDMETAAKELDPDAVYLPNPIPDEFLTRNYPHAIAGRIVFNMRWDDSKGGRALIDAARELVVLGYEVHGIDWGTHRNEAAAAGVKLRPLMPADEFSDFLATGQAIIGQLSIPALGISDMQSLATGRPLLMGKQNSSAPITPVSPETLVANTVDVMQSEMTSETEMQRAQLQREWLRDNHSEAQCLKAWESLYRKLLG